jgi:hypothetical protein
MQVAWSPLPQRGTLAVSVDGRAAVSYPVDGSEKMGNGSGVVTQGVAAIALTDAKYDTVAGVSLPAETLTITDLFPGETLPTNPVTTLRPLFSDLFKGYGGLWPFCRHPAPKTPARL